MRNCHRKSFKPHESWKKNMLSSSSNKELYELLSSYSRTERTLEELSVSHIQIHAPDNIEIRQLTIRRIKCGLNEENNRDHKALNSHYFLRWMVNVIKKFPFPSVNQHLGSLRVKRKLLTYQFKQRIVVFCVCVCPCNPDYFCRCSTCSPKHPSPMPYTRPRLIGCEPSARLHEDIGPIKPSENKFRTPELVITHYRFLLTRQALRRNESAQ